MKAKLVEHARRYAAALAASRPYEVRGEPRTRTVTPGEMALLRGVVAWLEERVTVPEGCFIQWNPGSLVANDGTFSTIVHDCDRVQEIFLLRLDDLFDNPDGAQLALLSELIRTSEVQS